MLMNQKRMARCIDSTNFAQCTRNGQWSDAEGYSFLCRAEAPMCTDYTNYDVDGNKIATIRCMPKPGGKPEVDRPDPLKNCDPTRE